MRSYLKPLCCPFTHSSVVLVSTDLRLMTSKSRYRSIPHLLFFSKGFEFVLWLDRILPNLPVRLQGFWLPAIKEHWGVWSYRPTQLRPERAEQVTALAFNELNNQNYDSYSSSFHWWKLWHWIFLLKLAYNIKYNRSCVHLTANPSVPFS